jgi:hypothetical protein
MKNFELHYSIIKIVSLHSSNLSSPNYKITTILFYWQNKVSYFENKSTFNNRIIRIVCQLYILKTSLQLVFYVWKALRTQQNRESNSIHKIFVAQNTKLNLLTLNYEKTIIYNK